MAHILKPAANDGDEMCVLFVLNYNGKFLGRFFVKISVWHM